MEQDRRGFHIRQAQQKNLPGKILWFLLPIQSCQQCSDAASSITRLLHGSASGRCGSDTRSLNLKHFETRYLPALRSIQQSQNGFCQACRVRQGLDCCSYGDVCCWSCSGIRSDACSCTRASGDFFSCWTVTDSVHPRNGRLFDRHGRCFGCIQIALMVDVKFFLHQRIDQS
ncbi:hypothetical protein MPTK1_6g05380 [Marchantia polymorpha subsp. ruderalis]|uniref:Uncharacterized protein n=2 Tax=Marchantia polymorpha TaxID=3197 RepID=A0AAF6BNS5_MARPO|nr:hypothetical protein MARPO_0167s0021 [Marchantia polymorpha]BBN13659.1 hypothetical protein Mp_6g05380 [Marchantia polymorpha subsp. ruderalis]|eukprot:PTQ28329.1 hypothetical protein MARPO_0167s0021 [Marchantia polymorpha]